MPVPHEAQAFTWLTIRNSILQEKRTVHEATDNEWSDVKWKLQIMIASLPMDCKEFAGVIKSGYTDSSKKDDKAINVATSATGLKLNFDGSARGHPSHAGIGALIRDE
ncbi:hypothetical protein AMTR_s00036p00176630 [Amborella trichopoda]|uniref:Uncharacterized protein n=1 Tax=Amborella trichopoda TaxID=13333 RepID=U5CZE6_AMBTC|nr:hypothetical protein AMTR_s00036p00176630 [Amborella trichopoda]